jgi:hypothetical protein
MARKKESKIKTTGKVNMGEIIHKITNTTVKKRSKKTK